MNINPMSLFSALPHETRLRCLVLIMHHDELCVCEITQATGAAQPHISRHLAQLRELDLVIDRREGLRVRYRIYPSLPGWVRGILREMTAGLSNQTPFADDLSCLAQMPNRPGAPRCA
jgi:ArsR family transcriptional regulator